MNPSHIGIDIADDPAKRSRVTLLDNGVSLTVAEVLPNYGEPLREHQNAALDSPLGYPEPFHALIQCLQVLDVDERTFKYRQTDDVLADRVASLPFVVEANAMAPGFFNRGSHVKPTLGLQIVPGAFKEVLRLLNAIDSQETQRIDSIQNARLGRGNVLEAHPRLFLYSALSRIRETEGAPLPLGVLVAAKDYKTPVDANQQEKQLRVESRQLLLSYLVDLSTQWLGQAHRQIVAEGVCARDHDFDALLCAFTAFAHAHNETWTWADMAPELTHALVGTEGHIFILRPHTDIDRP